jgi:hypothetical protein
MAKIYERLTTHERVGFCRVVDQTSRFPRKRHFIAYTGRTIPASAENGYVALAGPGGPVC